MLASEDGRQYQWVGSCMTVHPVWVVNHVDRVYWPATLKQYPTTLTLLAASLCLTRQQTGEVQGQPRDSSSIMDTLMDELVQQRENHSTVVAKSNQV